MAASEQPKLGNTTTDIIVSLTKGAVGAVPFVGSLIAEVVGNVIPNQRVDRIVEFVRLLEERLNEVAQQLLKSRFSDPVVVDLLEDAFTQAARATTKDRLEHIANVVANGISPDELKQAETKRMLWLLGQLTDEEIVILRGRLPLSRDDYQRDAEYQSRHSHILKPDVTHMGSGKNEFEEQALRSSYRQHLYDLGLVRHRFRTARRDELPEFDSKTGMMKSEGSEVTRLGRIFLRYLNLMPAWYRY
jgi:anion-transporting  ArsA/GET3 family ATPase